MKISQAEMDSRERVNDLRSEFTVAISKVFAMHGDNITYAELYAALIDTLRGWNGYELKDERQEAKQ